MIIGIDGNEANVLERVGISEYAYELLWQFSKYHVASIKYQVYVKDFPRDDMPHEHENWTYRIVKPNKLWTQVGLPLDLYFHRPRPHVFFTPTHYAPRFSPIPTVVSVMDVSYLFFPEMFRKSDLYQLRNWSSYSIKNARRIFTISSSSKDDIIKQYQVSPETVVVTYPGIKPRIMNDALGMREKDVLAKYTLISSYILFVGTLQPRKNIVRLIEAFAMLIKEEKQEKLDLVIVGKKGWLYEEILAAPKRFGVSDSVKFLEFVPSEDLGVLYADAQFFILPSLYEGFGLPILEAMQYGCPVITSNVSSLPEAGGDAALYVDPYDVGDIAHAMKKLLGNKTLRYALKEKGYTHVKKFSWEKTAKETLQVLEEVGREKLSNQTMK